MNKTIQKSVKVIVFLFLGISASYAQIDEADEKDNTLYEIEMDSINKKIITESQPMDDTTISERLDSSNVEGQDSSRIEDRQEIKKNRREEK